MKMLIRFCDLLAECEVLSDPIYKYKIVLQGRKKNRTEGWELSKACDLLNV